MPDVTPKTESGRARDVLLRAMQDARLYGRERQRIEDAADGMAQEAARKVVAEVIKALTDEDEIAHGEAVRGGNTNDLRSREGIGICAYCDGSWPCRTQRGINRLIALIDSEGVDVERLLEAHTPWARAVFAENALWMACYCGWNVRRTRDDEGTWNEHFLAAARLTAREPETDE